MPKHDIFFGTTTFFLIGILASSAGVGFTFFASAALILIFALALLGAVRGNKKFFYLSGIAFAVFIGYGYFDFRENQFGTLTIPSSTEVVEGYVARLPDERIGETWILVKPVRAELGIISARLPGGFPVAYGDRVNLRGKFYTPPDTARQFRKNGIAVSVDYPELSIIGHDAGSPLISFLYKVNGGARATFRKILPPDEAALLGGLTFGGRSDLSESLRQAMTDTGTSHLVALSGYNIAILIAAVSFVFRRFFASLTVFLLTTGVIIGFVVMTGAEASIVRAAIMGGVIILSNETGRLYSVRNAIALSALVMTIWNPYLLVFDIGFQLSFAALLGIVVLRKALEEKFRKNAEPGFLNWRENALTTIAAQLAVLPLIIYHFGAFPLVSVAANIAVLFIVPLAMLFGFAIAAAGFISLMFANLLGLSARLLLGYMVFAIKFFAVLPFPKVKAEGAPLAAVIAVWAVLVLFLMVKRKNANRDA